MQTFIRRLVPLVCLLALGAAKAPESIPPDAGTPGITIAPTAGLVTTEAGGVATFTVVLNAEPTGEVVVPLASSRAAEGAVTPSSVTFTAANWSTPQSVSVRGVDDRVADGRQQYAVRTMPAQSPADARYHGLDPADVGVSNEDDDVAGVTVRAGRGGLVTSETGGTATFAIALTSQPLAPVTISITSSNPAEGVVRPTTITFDASNWSTAQSVTIRGVDDGAADGDVAYSIVTGAAVSTDPAYNGREVADVAVTNTDDERARGGGAAR